jgi:hypothetical protein
VLVFEPSRLAGANRRGPLRRRRLPLFRGISPYGHSICSLRNAWSGIGKCCTALKILATNEERELKPYYGSEVLAQLQEEFWAVEPRYNALLLTYTAHRFANEEAREFAQHGFMRRLGTLRRCIENVYVLIPPETATVPDRPVLHDAQINIQAFFANVYGAIDNLAWVWVFERGLANVIPRNRVGFRSRHTEVRTTLSAEFQKYLETLDPWMDYVIEYRDALAHRIPLYVPPGQVRPENVDAYNKLSDQMTEALNVRQNGFAYERLASQQEQLLIFQPWITHSIRETTGHIRFHLQMLIDFKTIDEIGNKMLNELKTVR